MLNTPVTCVPSGTLAHYGARLAPGILNYAEFKDHSFFQKLTIFQWVSKCHESLLFGQ